MKKILALVLALLMILPMSLIGCEKKEEKTELSATQKIIEEIIDDGQNDEGVAEVMKFGVELIYGGLRIGYTILTSPTNAALRSAQYMMENISPDTKRAISMAKSCLSEVTSRGVAVAR